ncbi:MAG: hypothetical protein IPJ34_05190 [Myxococcales bacterium]|nr:hypothetical protein [Myxococcales bacterium]
MAGITFGGLATGLDTNALITGLMAAERFPYDALTTKSNLVAGARATISAMSSKLNALKTAADALSEPAGFASLVATSSDAAVVASTSGTGSQGPTTCRSLSSPVSSARTPRRRPRTRPPSGWPAPSR